MNERILMRVDFQNDFVDPEGKLTLNNLDLIYKHQHFCESLHCGMFAQIVDVADTHFEETYGATKEAETYPPHALYYSWGWHKAVDFKENIPLINLYKSTTNIWNEERNYALLQQDWKGKNVYLCGVLSDVCVRQAMDGFLKRGAKVSVLEDLCMGAQKQMSEIVSEPQYNQVREERQLRLITSAQFFREAIAERKQQLQVLNMAARRNLKQRMD